MVVLDVSVYSLDLTESEGLGINWNLVYNNLRSAGVGIGSGADLLEPNSLSFTIINPTDQANGSSVLIDALAEQGKVSMITQSTSSTLSGFPVPVQVAEETSYVDEVSTVLVADAGAQTTISSASVTTGFSVTMLPVVLDTKEVLMHVQLSLSNLRGLREFAIGDIRVERPQVDSAQLIETTKVPSNGVLVLHGFQQDRLRSDLRGIGSPKFTALGGSSEADQRRRLIVVTVSPRII